MAATVVALLVAGCGGDEGESSAATDGGSQGFTVKASTTMEPGKLRKAQFIARVNQYCRRAWVIILDNFKQYHSWLNKKSSAQKRFSMSVRLSLLAGIDFHIFDNIRLLGAPRGEEAEIEDIIGPMQEAVERGQRLDPLHSVAELEALFSVYNRRAQQYGLTYCPVDRAHIGVIEKAA